MRDSVRENLSYFGLYRKMLKVRKSVEPEAISFGKEKDQYFLYYEPETALSDKVIVWVHGGGWNAGTPKFFDFVGQCMAKEGYRCISLGYRLSPKYKYPCQIEDVCMGYRAAMRFLHEKGVDTSRVIVSGPSAGAHLTSILCYSRQIQEKMDIDVTNIVGFIGVGGPYSFSVKMPLAVKTLLNQLFSRGYDRKLGEPCALMEKSLIPMLLIQSRHDGLIPYECVELFYEKARELGNTCERYEVVDKKNTHSWYTAGMFLESRKENQGLNQFFSWIEER